jgi:hypothetical protein
MDEIVRSMVDNSGVKPPEDDGYGPRAGLCLEPQNFPDAPNHSNFPESRLDPGEVYINRVVYKFAADQSIMKIRKAFIMSVNAGAEAEYEKRHNPIWPELEKVLKDHGVSNYSIFLHAETHQLFGYAEIESEE